jgi:glycosyltransferase involved in cell wall biosynthesis
MAFLAMNIVILNLYYPPDTAATAPIVEDIAHALAMKHQVTVLAGRPSYETTERHPYYLFNRRAEGKVNVARVGSTAFHRKIMGGRLANYLSYMALALISLFLLRPRPDVIIAMTDPPLVSLIGLFTSWLRRSTFVYNIRDLHPDMAVAAGVLSRGFIASLWERVHRWVMRRTHLVIVLGEDMKERIGSKGVDPRRLVIVRDGADSVPLPQTLEHPAVHEIRDKFPFVVVHAGNLGFAGSWDVLLEAAKCVERENLGLVFVGEGAQRPALEQKASGIHNVRFLPFRPSEEVPYVLAAADLHVVTVKEGLEGLVVPSKLYPILMAGRPVLAVAPPGSDIARIVQKYRCGLVASPSEPQAVVKAMLWARDHPEDLAKMGRRAKETSSLFNRQTLLQEFVKTIDNLKDC